MVSETPWTPTFVHTSGSSSPKSQESKGYCDFLRAICGSLPRVGALEDHFSHVDSATKVIRLFWQQRRLTLKNAMVLPDSMLPYLIFVCFAKSSADSIGDSIRSTVRKAAKFAVYEEIIMRVKNHHIPATTRVDRALRLLCKTADYLISIQKYELEIYEVI